MNALEAAKVAEAALEDKLGEDIKVLDLRGAFQYCGLLCNRKRQKREPAACNGE